MTSVLCLTSWYPPHHFGGYELSCHDVMVRLVERGHRVEVLTSDHRHPGPDLPDTPGVPVHRELRLYFRDGDLWSPGPLGRLAVERHNQRALRDALRRVRPDVVAVWHMGALSLGLLSTLIAEGVPVVYAVSDDWPAYVRQLDPWHRMWRRAPAAAGRLFERVTRVPVSLPDLDRSGRFCFISEVTRERCRRSSPWSFPASSLVYSGFDGRRFAGGRDEPVRLDGDAVRLLYVGRIDERKGIRTIVRALPLLPGATLVIDGQASDDDRALLRRWTDEAGVTDRVTVQRSARDDLPAVYRSADVLVFASEWEEPFGLVPLEAMACGTPVVATGVGGSGEFLVDGENAALFTAGDPRSLADAVARLRADPALVDRLVAGGLATAERFDVEHLTNTFEHWYDAAAAGRHLDELGHAGSGAG